MQIQSQLKLETLGSDCALESLPSPFFAVENLYHNQVPQGRSRLVAKSLQIVASDRDYSPVCSQ